MTTAAELWDKARLEALQYDLELPLDPPRTGFARFPGAGKTSGHNGWANMKTDCCHFGDWAAGISITVFPDKHENSAERRRILAQDKRDRELRDQQAAELHRRAVLAAQQRVAMASPSPGSPYTRRKKVTPEGALKCFRTGLLLVPLQDINGQVRSYQLINNEGEKRFATNAPVAGLFFTIGERAESQPILVCEGASTGWSLRQMTGCQVIATMNAGNLLPVANAIREKYPLAEIVICGDDDRHTVIRGEKVNVGREKATNAAAVISAKVSFPRLCPDCKCSDFNDQMVCELDHASERA